MKISFLSVEEKIKSSSKCKYAILSIIPSYQLFSKKNNFFTVGHKRIIINEIKTNNEMTKRRILLCHKPFCAIPFKK